MNDKFKQIFAAPPWTPQQLADWEKTRRKGRAVYVARFVLWWSTMAVIVFSLGFHYLGGTPLSAKHILVNALIWYPYGLLQGLFFWSGAEKKYRESLNAKRNWPRKITMKLLIPLISIYLLTFATPAKAQDTKTKPDEKGFVTLFDGKSLTGWKLIRRHGPGYVVKDGVLVCPADGGGNLFTEKEYSNFVFRFEFKTEPGGNNGVGIRAPLEGDSAYQGMEIQILDDGHERYKGKIRSEQHHGSIYDVIPARTGYLKPAGEWNEEEIMAQGSHIRVTLNGVIILDADLNNVREEATLKKHPGLKNKSGHIGFLGHGSLVEFRNIRIKALP